MTAQSGTSPSRTAPQSPQAVSSHLRLAVVRLARVMRQQARTDLTPTKVAHLGTIEREGPITLSELATIEQVAAPTVTKVVKELVALGLVSRKPDETDRRATLVEVTAEGRRRLDESRTRKDQWLARRVAALPPEDVRRLSEALGVLERLAAPEAGGADAG